ncbi:Phosphate-binding protein PstS [Pandoraea terrae]|uniref:Phosphate-binding protein PstS n=1 Tax=Pandoraea terrae TaxID=1537710 RepID=A0A5E4V2M7_9BURK|nr:substrate-binding domain-containing protein [Pandoraea terrae]VVE06522.1 Phosphate-binding protein PstS [Pandoraea terrae]
MAGLLLSAGNALAAPAVDSALPAYQPEAHVAGPINSVGDDAMKPLMNDWLAAFEQRQPGIRRGTNWRHVSGVTAFGALMFGNADIAPLTREPWPTELQPYAHQFAGDMMKSPVLVHVASVDGRPAYIAVNQRPGAPLPQKVKEFLAFMLSRDGQAIVARHTSFAPISASESAQETARLQAFLPPLDPALSNYKPVEGLHGKIDSIGSDGMKSLMDTWIQDFHRIQPGVRKGDRWEHLGTLNGFHALLVNDTDMAPMGRELWPEESRAYDAAQHGKAPLLEIRVARGGFNTPQRTTAQAIFVPENNPLAQITVAQLADILGEHPSITRWGQLGLTGEWANRPITLYMPPHVAPNAMSMQIMVLKGRQWNPAVHEGSIAQTAEAIARDPGAIGFGGLEEGGAGLKALAVAGKAGGPFYALNAENAASGRYPLTRYMYIRLSRPLSEPVKAFLRYVLSRAGQEPVRYSAYFPLSAAEAQQELDKLK